jgi:hypothetical protein
MVLGPAPLRWAFAIVVITAVTGSTTARANGRFPEAQAIESVPGGDGNTLFLRTTFGVLVSGDAGRHWRWICERALGYDGQWDPPIAVTRDGRLWVGLEGGLSSTRDGCQVDRTPELDGHTIKDLTTDARGETLWAITGAPGKRSFVWRRTPGHAFERLAGMDDTNFMTIEVAPSLPSRVYVSGQPYSTIRGRIYRSDDGGASLKSDVEPGRDAGSVDGGPRSPAALVADGPLFIGAVDPEDPRRLLVRHLHAKGSDLYLSKDGGRTLKNVLSMTSAMFGFAKSSDGTTIWAGSGLAEHGLFRSTDRGEHFERIGQHGVLCLHAAGPEALFVCENAFTMGAPAVAVARDGIGGAITPLARFSDVDGPVQCSGAPPDAAASLCAGSWTEMRALLLPAPPSSRASASASSSPTPEPNESTRTRRSSCGCDVVGDRALSSAACWLCAAIVGAVAASRRRSRGSLADQARAPRRC